MELENVKLKGFAVEIVQIKQALNIFGLLASKFFYINASKRVNSRYFAGDNGRFQNPQPGTVVDSNFTYKFAYKLYIVSLAAKQGI